MKKEKNINIIKNISVLTLGCSKNLVDSENLIGILEANGYTVMQEPEEADSVIINTCGFINDAKQESLNLIFSIGAMKKKSNVKKLIVIGCLSQRYKEALMKQVPDVDHFFGINEYGGILEALGSRGDFITFGERYLLTPNHYAYLKISEGCSHRCAFCAIPIIRGNYISRPIEDIIAEAGAIAEKGVKELLIIAQDTTFYGLDLYKERKLGALLEKLALSNRFEWIRLMYTYPAGFPMDVLDVMAAHDSICKYIDIPLQHISDNILEGMKRHIDSAKIKELISNIREKLPGAAIRSTFITGFPGETEEDFEQLYDFIAEYNLDRVGVFTYSHEDSTPAFNLKDNVPEEIKLLRKEALMIKQAEISLEKNKRLIGTTLRVLIDDEEDGKFIARSQYDAPEIDNSVLIDYHDTLKPGDFADVVIYDASEYDLFAAADSKTI